MKLTAARFQYLFTLVAGIFSFTVFYQQLMKEKRVYVEMNWSYYQDLQSRKPMYQSSNVDTKRVVKRLTKEIKDLRRVLERRQKFEIRIKSSFYMTRSSGDLALDKKYPEFPMTFTHRDIHMCGSSTSYKILILVFSENGNQDLRNTIRKTWGALKSPETELRWRVIYIVGRPLDKAGKDKAFFDEVMRNDLLGVHAKNSKTMQALYGALYWALNGCSFEKLLVMRENMFLNVQALYKGIHKFQQKNYKDLYINTLSSQTSNKAEEDKKKPFLKSFQTFNSNGAWMISRRLATRLLPEIRIFMNSDFEGTSTIVNEMMASKLKLKSQKSKLFFTDQRQCVLSSFILSAQRNGSCIGEIYRQI
eukprot:TCONS_00017131-protein